jgi:hypothetical protein
MWGTYLELSAIAAIKNVSFIVYDEDLKGNPERALPRVGLETNPTIYLWLTGEDLGAGHYSLLLKKNNTESQPTFTVVQVKANGDCMFDAALMGIEAHKKPGELPQASTPEAIIALRSAVSAALDADTIALYFRNYITVPSLKNSEDAKLRLPNSVILEEAKIWRFRLSTAIYFGNKLRGCAKTSKTNEIQALIHLGVDINDQLDHFDIEKYNTKNTALHEALIAYEMASNNSSSKNALLVTIQLLRQNGARDDLENSSHITPRMLATKLGIIKHLDVSSTNVMSAPQPQLLMQFSSSLESIDGREGTSSKNTGLSTTTTVRSISHTPQV